MRKITTPLTKPIRAKLRCGEEVLLSGTVYTARDTVHKKLAEAIRNRKTLPIALKDAVIYYCGPTELRAGGCFGSAGPTTSSRMDEFTPLLFKKGLGAMIGKGSRSEKVKNLIKKKKAVYFLAAGGAGAYLAKRIVSAKKIAFKKLGTEAVYKLTVRDFPLIVGIDSRGKDIYEKKR